MNHPLLQASTVRTLVKQSFVGACAYYLATDFITGLRTRSGSLETSSGMAHAGKSIESSLSYIEGVFADYKRYSGLERFTGRIAEVGPGDNCGVALMFLADGCEHVDLVDRFYSRRNVEQHASIYAALLARQPRLRERLGDVDLRDESSFQAVQRRYGESASAEEFFVHSRHYDAIVSRAVLEHVYDPLLSLERMALALKPGGVLLHKVDLRDHGMFSGAFHELKFLEVPDWLYPRISASSGRPNRVLAHDYRPVLHRTLPDHEIFVTRLAGVGEIDPHLPYERIPPSLRKQAVAYVKGVRHRFAASLSAASDEDLSIAGIFIVARKAKAAAFTGPPDA